MTNRLSTIFSRQQFYCTYVRYWSLESVLVQTLDYGSAHVHTPLPSCLPIRKITKKQRQWRWLRLGDHLQASNKLLLLEHNVCLGLRHVFRGTYPWCYRLVVSSHSPRDSSCHPGTIYTGSARWWLVRSGRFHRHFMADKMYAHADDLFLVLLCTIELWKLIFL
jgi:hypothetical protein